MKTKLLIFLLIAAVASADNLLPVWGWYSVDRVPVDFDSLHTTVYWDGVAEKTKAYAVSDSVYHDTITVAHAGTYQFTVVYKVGAATYYDHFMSNSITSTTLVAEIYGADSATYATPAGSMGKAMSATGSAAGGITEAQMRTMLDSLGLIYGRPIKTVVHAASSNTTFDVDTTTLGFSGRNNLLGCLVFFSYHDGKPSFFRTGIKRAVNGGGYDTLTMIDTITAVAGDTVIFFRDPWWDFEPVYAAAGIFADTGWHRDTSGTYDDDSWGRLMILAAAAGADTAAFKTLLTNNGYKEAKDSINVALMIGLSKSLPRIGNLNIDTTWMKTFWATLEMNLGKILGSSAAAREFLRACDSTATNGGMHVARVDTSTYVDTLGSQVQSGGDDPAGVRFVVRVWDATNSAAVSNAMVTWRASATATTYDHRKATNPSGNAVVTIDTGSYTIFVEATGLNFPDSAYTITGADSILISGTGVTFVASADPAKCAVVGQLWKLTSKNGVSSACANCDAVFELMGPNCTDTVTAQTGLWVTKMVRTSADANGYITAYLPITGNMKCEDGSSPLWKMTVTVGNKRTEVTFATPDTTTVDIGSLMK